MLQSLQWLTQDVRNVPEHEAWLTEGERSRLAGMRFPKRCTDWKLGRWTAKCTVWACRFCDIGRDSLPEIRTAADGAPETYLNDKPVKISISISHSRERSLCVVGPDNFGIGCDIEFLEVRETDFFRDYFTAEENSFVEQNARCDRITTALLIWSAKESTLKILRQGLRRDTRSISIRPDFLDREGNWHSWTGQCLQTSQTFQGWWRTCDGFVYTLASDRPTALPDQLHGSF
jgi:4'-phosphopantetheinyl transferase